MNSRLLLNWSTEYEVGVVTGTAAYAGTDANVYITLTGKNGVSRKLHLMGKSKAQLFERGKQDTFCLRVKDLGPLTSVRY